ncbi:hypothetical protein EBU94_01205 [bacterium]|nr:hypothetical protein [bacterium]
MNSNQDLEQRQVSSNDALATRFRKEREEWISKIQDFSDNLRTVSQIGELMVEVYSQRQIAVEYSHTLMSHIIKINKIYREKKHEKYIYYTQNYDVRLDKDAREGHIGYDLTEIIEKRDMVQNHLEYFRETIKTIDNIIFGIKHRISLEEYRRG